MNIPVGINNKLHLAWKYACSDICPRKLTFLRSQKFSESVAWGNCKLWESCMQCTRTNIRWLFNAKWRLLLTQLARQLFLFSKTPGDISKPFLWIWRKIACRRSELYQNVSEMQCFRISWVRSIDELLFFISMIIYVLDKEFSAGIESVNQHHVEGTCMS